MHSSYVGPEEKKKNHPFDVTLKIMLMGKGHS